ncbi:D-alanyl-D-alanine carboxypeptidase, partial [Mesorhizobium sp. M3A.F.Ca.ET.201.01.1.1]
NDLHDEICKKKTKGEQSEAAPAVAAKDKPKSPYQVKLEHPTLIAVGLGGATGPAPKAFVDQADQNYADVPLPTWRPDKPLPAGAAPAATASAAAQGDQPAKAAN